MKYTKAFSADSEEELNNAIITDGLSRSKRSQIIPASNTGHQLSLEQRVINLEGQSKVLYDRLLALENAPAKDKTIKVPQSVLDDIAAMKTEITKNVDSLTQAHLDMNEFIKTHPSDADMDAKLRILNNLITELKTTQSNAQLLINSNKATLDKLKNTLIPSNFRRLYRIMAGDSPSINVTDNILTFNKVGDKLTLELPIPDEASDVEIVLNNSDPFSFYIPEYRNSSDPLRARLTAGGLDIQIKGENAKVEIWCTADPKHIGIMEWRTKWTTGSIS